MQRQCVQGQCVQGQCVQGQCVQRQCVQGQCVQRQLVWRWSPMSDDDCDERSVPIVADDLRNGRSLAGLTANLPHSFPVSPASRAAEQRAHEAVIRYVRRAREAQAKAR